MELTRREFFKTTAVASTTLVIVTTPALGAIDNLMALECQRQVAFRMKDQLIRDFKAIEDAFPAEHNLARSNKYSWRATPLGKQWSSNVTAFLDHLHDNITGPEKSFVEIVDEIAIIIKGRSRDGSTVNIDIMSCSDIAFAVCLIVDCLKHHRMPIIYARNWKRIAKKYTKYVMAA